MRQRDRRECRLRNKLTDDPGYLDMLDIHREDAAEHAAMAVEVRMESVIEVDTHLVLIWQRWQEWPTLNIFKIVPDGFSSNPALLHRLSPARALTSKISSQLIKYCCIRFLMQTHQHIRKELPEAVSAPFVFTWETAHPTHYHNNVEHILSSKQVPWRNSHVFWPRDSSPQCYGYTRTWIC